MQSVICQSWSHWGIQAIYKIISRIQELLECSLGLWQCPWLTSDPPFQIEILVPPPPRGYRTIALTSALTLLNQWRHWLNAPWRHNTRYPWNHNHAYLIVTSQSHIQHSTARDMGPWFCGLIPRTNWFKHPYRRAKGSEDLFWSQGLVRFGFELYDTRSLYIYSIIHFGSKMGLDPVILTRIPSEGRIKKRLFQKLYFWWAS